MNLHHIRINQILRINISSTIQQLSFIILAIYTIYLSIKYRKKLGHYFYFGLIAILGIAEGIDSQIVNPLFQKKIPYNILLFNLYIIVEFSVLSLFFLMETNSFFFKKIIKVISISLIILILTGFIIDKDFIRNNYQFFSLVEAVIMLCYAIKIFVEVIFDDEITHINMSSKFITAFGIFCLFSLTLPYFLLTSYLKIFNAILYNKLDFISNLAYIFFYITIIKSFWIILKSFDIENNLINHKLK